VSTDRFTLDVLREGFAAITDEMFVSLQRTAQSPVLYEVLDFGVGIADARGELVSQGNGIAGFLGPLGDVIKATTARVHGLRAGDVIIANDPYSGGGTHLSDVALVRPIFWEQDLIGFAAAKGHWTEVGGKDPGSWTADSTDIYAEGLQLPFVHAYREGVAVPEVRAILAANSRLPEMTLGDLSAQAACLEVAERRLHELCAKFGAGTVVQAMGVILDRSERLARLALTKIPHGTFTASDFTDEDGLGNGPFPVQVQVHISVTGVTCDFTGSHRQVPGPINCTWSGLVSGVRTVFKAITDPAAPATDGWFRPLKIICPAGTIFNARRPAPVAAYFESTEMASDLVWHALAAAFPERLTAGTFVSVCSTSLALTHPDTGEQTLLVEPQPGGWGANAVKDGEHGLVSVGDGETYVIPVEVAEQRYGIRVERFGFDIVEGAGAGRRRGGRGLVREYRILCDEALLTVAWGRHRFPPWGTAGGRDGSCNYVEVLSADGRSAQRFGKASRLPLRRGDLVRLVTGSGGGYGDPRERETELILDDLRNEIITRREAAETYGIRAISRLPIHASSANCRSAALTVSVVSAPRRRCARRASSRSVASATGRNACARWVRNTSAARPSWGSGRRSTRPSRSSRRTIVVIVCLLSRARLAISPIRRPSSSYSGTRIDPYEGRTSGKPAAAKRSASSSFQRWLALASKKPRLSRVNGDGPRMAPVLAVSATGRPAPGGRPLIPPLSLSGHREQLTRGAAKWRRMLSNSRSSDWYCDSNSSSGIPGALNIVKEYALLSSPSAITRVGNRASWSSAGPAYMSMTPLAASASIEKQNSPRPLTTFALPCSYLSSWANSVAQCGRFSIFER